MKSVMQHMFSQIPSVKIQRSVFNRSHGHKTTFDSGWLVPFYVDEALPGDTFKLQAALFARLATPIFPIMDNMFLETFYFAVPNRLLWDHWQAFMGEQMYNQDTVDYMVPQCIAPDSTGFTEGSMFDYMGIPTKIPGIAVNALPMRAYNLIYNEWFRDENLCWKQMVGMTMTGEMTFVERGDGPDVVGQYEMKRRGKRHDYFTSCLPWPQKGDDVTINVAGAVGVYGTGYPLGMYDGIEKKGTVATAETAYMYMAEDAYGMPIGPSTLTTPDVWTQKSRIGLVTKEETLEYGEYHPEKSGLYADMAAQSVITINDLREAFQIQKMLERDARGGTRYIEIIRAHFGVNSPDSRMQRPEYLGGSSCRIIVNPVQQTSETTSGNPLGKLGAYAIAAEQSSGFSKSFVEHCTIIGLVNVRADLTYQKGIDRMWSRLHRIDYYWPEFANLGEQPVYKQELMATGTSEDAEVFGYQERFAEYRYANSKITGKFRRNATGSLDAWHLSQDLQDVLDEQNAEYDLSMGCPILDYMFIEDKPPIQRVVAVKSPEPEIIFDSFIQLQCARPMPVYSVPGLIDHF